MNFNNKNKSREFFGFDDRDEPFSVYDKKDSINDIINHISVMYPNLTMTVDSTLRMHYKDIKPLSERTKTISLRYPSHGSLYLPFNQDHQNNRHFTCYVKNPDDQNQYVPFGEIDVSYFAISTIHKLPHFVLHGTGYQSVDEAVADLSLKNEMDVGEHDLVSVYFLENFKPYDSMYEIIEKYDSP